MVTPAGQGSYFLLLLQNVHRAESRAVHSVPLNNIPWRGRCWVIAAAGKKKISSSRFGIVFLTITVIGITSLGSSLRRSLKCHAKNYNGAFVAWRELASCHNACRPQFIENLHGDPPGQQLLQRPYLYIPKYSHLQWLWVTAPLRAV